MMKVNRTLLKLAIICVALNDAGNSAVGPALGSIMQAFPQAPSLVQLIATLPALFIALTPPVYAKCLEFMKKKTWLYIGALTFIIGGVAPAFFNDNIYAILFFRAVLGISCGILTPMATDLCVDFFEGEERTSMIGYVSATVGVSGILFQLFGGYLAGFKWEYCFYAYLIGILFLIVPIIFLPEPDRNAKIQAELQANVSKKLNSGVYVFALLMMGFFFFWYVAPTNVAVVLMMDKMAGPAQIGVVFSLITAGSFVMSAIFGKIFKIFKFTLLPIAYLFAALALYLCYQTHSLTVFGVGLTFLGIGMGLIVPTTISKITSLVSYSASASAIGLAYFGLGIGGFIQPLVFNLFSVPGRQPFLIGVIGMIVLAVLSIIANKSFPSKVHQENSLSA